MGTEDFPYARILGKGEDLNHAKFPDLYYCAITHYKSAGLLGTEGNFIQSDVAPDTSKAMLDKYCKITPGGAALDADSITQWVQNASDLGLSVSNEDVNRMRKRLKRKKGDSSDSDTD